MTPFLLLLLGCVKPQPIPPPIPPSQIIPPEPLKDPPLPPPAPVDLGFRWPDMSACLMSTRMTETITADKAPISTLNGVGSGVVFAQRRDDGNWEVSLEDRSGTARHSPSPGGLLVALEEIQLDLEPTLVVDADGREVLEVKGMEDVWAKNQGNITGLVHDSANKAVESLWMQSIPVALSNEALVAQWRGSWSDGWGFAFGEHWEYAAAKTFTSSTGGTVEAVYLDTVPCKFNEDEPQCVRIELIYDDIEPLTPPARVRAFLPPGAEQEATREQTAVERRGELVMEASTGFPWRWTLVEIEDHAFHWGDDNLTELTLKRKQEVACDWRVSE